MKFSQKSLRTRGFSLVEVMLALGVCGLCILPVLGLLSQGLSSLGDSIDRQAEARIVQSLVSHYQANAWAPNNSGTPQAGADEFFFDRNGMQVDNSGDQQRHYAVKTLFPSPGGSADPYLCRMVVRITSRPAWQAALQENSGQYVQRATWIANTDPIGSAAQ